MTASEIIDELGGTSEVARLCEIKPPSVSEWRRTGIPKPWAKYLRAIRPDAFERVKVAADSQSVDDAAA